ncbi:class I SAM-dependent methyltransferase [Candidatus Woesearchaeota archaeon]|nr:class I SAM-dependent methyltransferase [Candidatus Woesearchaeota archaeon]
MTLEKHTKKMYDDYGAEYQRTRDERHPDRLFNEYLEVPSMVKAVGNIKGKRLLDIGCGAGVHAKKYLNKGAKVWGIDLSKTMIELARKRCPGVEFAIGSMRELPYRPSMFDIATASLSVDYIKDLGALFTEISRVLKKGGLFYYSVGSPVSESREKLNEKGITGNMLGWIEVDGKKIVKGKYFKEGLYEWEMVPGMVMRTYKRGFGTNLRALRKAGFELVDFIDCKPAAGFRIYDPEGYKQFNRYPIFHIYVGRKK